MRAARVSTWDEGMYPSQVVPRRDVSAVDLYVSGT